MKMMRTKRENTETEKLAYQLEARARMDAVKQIAVENFVGSLSGNRTADEMNLAADAKSYGWNAATVGAIKAGIAAYYDGAVQRQNHIAGCSNGEWL